MAITVDDVWYGGLVPENRPTPNPDRPTADQIACCQEWIRAYCTPRKKENTKYSSYNLKHAVERWTDGQAEYTGISMRTYKFEGNEHKYISNGAFIVAAILEGYTATPVRRGSSNACFNMKFVDVHPLVVEMKLAVEDVKNKESE